MWASVSQLPQFYLTSSWHETENYLKTEALWKPLATYCTVLIKIGDNKKGGFSELCTMMWFITMKQSWLGISLIHAFFGLICSRFTDTERLDVG